MTVAFPGYRPKQNEDLFYELFQNNPVTSSITREEDGIFLDCNNAFLRAFGFSSKSLVIGKTATQLGVYAQKNRRQQLVDEFNKNDKSLTAEVQFQTQDGNSFWLSLSFQHVMIDGISCILSNGIDITYRRDAECALSILNEELEHKISERTQEVLSSEKKFRALVENSEELILLADTEGNLTYASPALLKITGYHPNEIIGKKFGVLLHSEYAAQSVDIHSELVRFPGRIIPRRTCFVHKDGSLRYMEGSVTNWHNDPGINAIVANFRDVTRQRKAEMELERSEKRFRALIENSTDAFAILNVNGDLHYISPSIMHVLGYSEDEMLRINIFSLVHPSDAVSVMKTMEKVISLQGNPVPCPAIRMKHKDNSWKWCEATSTNMLHDPAMEGIVVNFRDVTAKKIAESQKEFDHLNTTALINNTHDLMWSIDRDCRLITSNRAFDELTLHLSGHKVTKGSLTLGAGFSDEQLSRWTEYYTKAFSGQTFTVIEYTKEPFEFWSEISFHPIFGRDGVVGTACYSRDITALKIAERQMQQHYNKLSEIISFQSHQVRGPVASILGIISLFRFDEPANPINTIVLEKLRKSTKAFDHVIRQIVKTTAEYREAAVAHPLTNTVNLEAFEKRFMEPGQ